MANGIPPFLPATPPPMCELDFYEDEDDDEFGDFSNASEIGYHDNVAVSRVSADNTLNDPKHVFDPGTLHETTPNHQETLTNTFPNGIKDDSFCDVAHHETISESVQELSVQSQSILEINVSQLSEKSEILNGNYIPLDSVKDDASFKSITTNINVETDLCLNDDDSSLTGSFSENCDKNVSLQKDNISINFDNGLESDSDFSNFISKDSIKTESAPEQRSIENFTPVNGSADTEDDFASFMNSNDTNQSNEPNTVDNLPKLDIEQTEQSYLRRGISEDSDDSNIPDIDFNCFITCPSESATKEIFDDDDFGDFIKPAELDVFDKNSSEEFPPVSSPHSETAANFELNDEFHLHDIESSTQVTIDHVKMDKETIDMDDDFTDFVSTTCPAPSDNHGPPNYEKIDQEFDDFEPFTDYSAAENLQLKEPISQDIAKPSSSVDLEKMFDLSAECWNDVFKACAEDAIEVNLNTLEGKLNGSSVWCKIKDIESSPALSYSWNNSETQKILLSALYVDSRNILFGPRWSSEVPRFASNLGFSPLVPQKAPESKDGQSIENFPKPIVQESIFKDTPSTSSHVPTSVPDAHFDWNNSGLTNPLDNYLHSSLLDLDLLASFDIHSPYYKKNRKGGRTKGSNVHKINHENSLFAKAPHREELSEEAKEVLKNLPNLYVMEKQYIVFPVS